LAAAKGGFTGRKHKKHAEEATSLAIDVQCGEKRVAINYSKKWQKMRRRIIQEFHLKWRKWAFYQRDPKTSEWVKLTLPHGVLDSEASYRVVIRPQDINKKPRPGIGRRLERRRMERESGIPMQKLTKFEWSAENGDQKQVEVPAIKVQVPAIKVQKRSPSPPLRIIPKQVHLDSGRVVEAEKVWVDLLFAGQRKSIEVLTTISQVQIEQLAKEQFTAPIKIWNFETPINGRAYKCAVDRNVDTSRDAFLVRDVVAIDGSASKVKAAEKHEKKKANAIAKDLEGSVKQEREVRKQMKSDEQKDRREKRVALRKASSPNQKSDLPMDTEEDADAMTQEESRKTASAETKENQEAMREEPDEDQSGTTELQDLEPQGLQETPRPVQKPSETELREWRTARENRKKEEQLVKDLSTLRKQKSEERKSRWIRQNKSRENPPREPQEIPDKRQTNKGGGDVEQLAKRLPGESMESQTSVLTQAERETLAAVAILKEFHEQQPKEVRETLDAQAPQDEATINPEPGTQKPLEAPVVKAPTIPLSRLSDFFPTGDRWDGRWEGESEANHKERTAKSRSDWITRYTNAMKKGTAKQKMTFQFYQTLVKSGQSPQPYRKPPPPAEKIILDVGILSHFPGSEDQWTWRWKGENDNQWEERLRMGYLDWCRYIGSAKTSKRPEIKEKVGFYVQLMKEKRYPEPIQSPTDLEEEEDMHAIQYQKSWIDRVKDEIPAEVDAWRELMWQTLEIPQRSPPSGLAEWQRKWWFGCWDQYYAQFKEEDSTKWRAMQALKETQRKAELEKQKEAGERKIREYTDDQLSYQIQLMGRHTVNGEILQQLLCEKRRRREAAELQKKRQNHGLSQDEAEKKRDLFTNPAQLPSSKEEISGANEEDLKSWISGLRTAHSYADLKPEHLTLLQVLKGEMAKKFPQNRIWYQKEL
jgi:hypothetical protein